MSTSFLEFAKKIRKPEENWQECIQRASEIKQRDGLTFKRPESKSGIRQKRTFKGKTHSECYGLSQEDCIDPCGWINASKPDKNGKVKNPYCRLKKVGTKKAKSIQEALALSFPEFGMRNNE